MLYFYLQNQLGHPRHYDSLLLCPAEMCESELWLSGRCAHLGRRLEEGCMAMIVLFTTKDGDPPEKTGQKFMFHMGGVYACICTHIDIYIYIYIYYIL